MNKTQKFIDEYLAKYESYKDYWNYEDGCVLIGAKGLYEATGHEGYLNFILEYLSRYISEDGDIINYQKDKFSIDSVNAGKILFFAYDKTGEEKYRKAMEVVMDQLRHQPRCKCGNFFHKALYPGQIWLDGLYMAQPFYMEYTTRFENKEHYNDIINQFLNVQKYLYDEEKGLCYHAFDEERKQFWADKESGCSQNFWLRSMGWYLMALIDTMSVTSIEIYEQYRKLQDIFKLMVKGMLRYADESTGLFYQIIDRDDAEGNYLETSGSAMVGYAILKACRMGVLQKEKYQHIGERIVESLIEYKLSEKENEIHLNDICLMAGLGPENKPSRDGSVGYYLSEPVVCDDAKGVGPFMMAYSQYLMIKKED